MKDIIIKVNTKTSVAGKDDYYIGTQGQNLQNKLIFEMSEKVQGVAWLEYEIDGSKNYALMNDNENGYEIDIKSCLLVSDSVNVNLRITEEQNPTGIPIFVSTISNFKVYPSIQATDEEPEQYPSWLDIANSKIVEINEKIDEVDNIDIDVSKLGKVTTVEITKKDGTAKSEDIRDGYDLDYRWNGTKLGVKREDEQEYQETDLQGPEGRQGIQGEPGHTPVKYVDYFTEEEQEEFKEEIVNDANSEFNRNVTEKTTAFNQNAMTKANEFNSNATNKTNTFNDNVTSKTTDFNTNATNKTADYNTNASEKLETYNTNHTNKLNAYNENASTKTSEFDSHVVSKTTEFDNNATSKTTDFNTNATNKTNDFNTNATNKTTEFNDNAQSKTDEFNENKEKLQKDLDYYKTVINALPKVEDEDIDITLNDTADSPLSLAFKASDSTQNSTTGKNLLPTQVNNWEQGTISGSGDLPSTTRLRTKDYYPIEPNTNYYISIQNSNYCYLNIILYDNNKQYVGQYYEIDASISGAINKQINIPISNVAYMRVTLRNTDNVSTILSSDIENIKPQMELGTSKTDWEPYTGNQPAPSPDYSQDIHVVKGDNDVKVSDMGSLPANYTQLDYIESSGTQYIDTDFKPNHNTTVELDYNYIDDGITRHDWSAFGVNALFVVSSSNISPLLTKYNNVSYVLIGQSTLERYKVKLDKNNLYVNNVLKYTFTTGTFSTNYSALLFARRVNSNGGVEEKSKMRLYNCKIWDNNILIRDFVPCYRNSDNEVGLYDIINNTFYTNQGTGAFIRGNAEKFQNYPLSLGVENKFDGELEQGSYLDDTGAKYNVTTNYRNKNIISVRPNQTYTFSINGVSQKYVIFNYDEYKNYIGRTVLNSGTFTTDINTHYINFRCFQDDYTSDFATLKVQLEEGDTPHSYSPYGQEPIELCNINNYADEFFKNVPECEYYDENLELGKWYKYGRFSKVDLSTLTWTQQTTQAGYVLRYTTSITDIKYVNLNTQLGNGLAEKYMMHIGSGMSTAFNNIAIDTNAVRVSSIESPSGLFYYELATPTKTLLSDTLQTQLDNISYAMAYQDQTNISQNNEDRPFVISASTVLDLNTLVSRIAVLESEV